MKKYSTDVLAEAKAAVDELERRNASIDKTASSRERGQTERMLKAAKERLAELKRL
jgi:hypothetical protein